MSLRDKETLQRRAHARIASFASFFEIPRTRHWAIGRRRDHFLEVVEVRRNVVQLIVHKLQASRNFPDLEEGVASFACLLRPGQKVREGRACCVRQCSVLVHFYLQVPGPAGRLHIERRPVRPAFWTSIGPFRRSRPAGRFAHAVAIFLRFAESSPSITPIDVWGRMCAREHRPAGVVVAHIAVVRRPLIISTSPRVGRYLEASSNRSHHADCNGRHGTHSALAAHLRSIFRLCAR